VTILPLNALKFLSHYASAVSAVIVSLSVHLSQAGIVSKWL